MGASRVSFAVLTWTGSRSRRDPRHCSNLHRYPHRILRAAAQSLAGVSLDDAIARARA